MFGDLSAEFKDIQIMLFPCNQFLSQEPSSPTAQSIRRLSTEKLDMDQSSHVKLFGKVDVNGDNASPVFQFLRYNSSLYDEGKHIIKPIPWNFGKFLVDPSGGVHKFYPQSADAKIKEDIKTLLSGSAPPSPTRRPSTKM